MSGFHEGSLFFWIFLQCGLIVIESHIRGYAVGIPADPSRNLFNDKLGVPHNWMTHFRKLSGGEIIALPLELIVLLIYCKATEATIDFTIEMTKHTIFKDHLDTYVKIASFYDIHEGTIALVLGASLCIFTRYFGGFRPIPQSA